MQYAIVNILSDSRLVAYKIADTDLNVGDLILVEDGQVKETAKIIKFTSKSEYEIASGKIIRKINARDQKKIDEVKTRALEFLPFCEDRITQFNLPMKVVDIELSFDEKKLTIYFSSDARVDFRKLVGDFARNFKKLIRLQQINPRQQAKKIGGCGKCGQTVCCARLCRDCGNITLEKAKNQNLSEVNVNKINGVCGKLMCCLEYEEDFYRQLKKNMPKVGEKIKTVSGIGVIIKQNILTQSVTVKLANGERLEVKV